MTGLRVEAVDPCREPRWRELAEGPDGSLFVSPPWLSAVSECYGFTPTARIAVDSTGRPVAGFAWVDVDDLRGRRRVALPFCDRAEPILTGGPSERAAGWTAVSADALAGDLPVTMRRLDEGGWPEDPRLHAAGEAAWHATALDAPADELWGRFRPSTRRNIATAARSGVQVTLSPDVDALYEYHLLHVAQRKRKYGLLAQPRTFFENVWKAFSAEDRIRTGLARIDGDPVAGAVYLVWGDRVYYKFGASLSAHLRHRPNDALHWELIRWAAGHGLRELDWGLSDLDQPGLVRYKRNWAGRERRIRTLRGGPVLPQDPEVGRLLQGLTGLLTSADVPDHVTGAGGALLYRYFC